MWFRTAGRRLLASLGLLVLAGFGAATLLRFAPGQSADELLLDARLSEDSRESILRQRAAETDVVGYYATFLRRVLEGDLGFSRSLNRPVRELLAERLPVTLVSVVEGLVGGWGLALFLTLPAAMFRRPLLDAAGAVAGGVFLCLPSALLALLVFLLGGPPGAAIALVVFPKVHRFMSNLLSSAAGSPHVITARAKGLSVSRIFFRHTLPAIGPQALSLAGVSVSLALAAAIPMEVICGSAGVGQLAWLAATGRDLPVLIAVTMLIAAVTLAVNALSDLAAFGWKVQPS